MENILSLPILIFSPILAVLILFIPFFNGKSVLIRRFSKWFASLHFLYSLLFLLFSENYFENGLAFYKNIKFFGKNWVDILGIKFLLAVDGFSLLLVILTSFVFLLAIIASKNNITSKTKFYYSMVFLLQTSYLGIFCARDMFLFYMFWFFALIPVYFLISMWGTGNCKKSAVKFLIPNSFGAILILIGILLLHFYNFAAYSVMTADFSEIDISNPQFPLFMQILISILLLIGFMIKIPVFPLHTWLIDSHADAPAPVSLILSSVGLVIGIYGILRFNAALLPQAFVIITPILTILAFITILYCSLVAFAQTDIKKTLCYLTIATFGFSILGICSSASISLLGSVYMLISNSVLIIALYMIVGILFLRTKTYDLIELGGLCQVMPKLTGFSIVSSVAFIGMPLFSNFIAYYLIFYSFIKFALFDSEALYLKFIAVFLPFLLIVISASVLKCLHKVFFGNAFERWIIGNGIPDITNHELIVLVTCIAVIIVLGIYPEAVNNIVQPYVENLINILQV